MSTSTDQEVVTVPFDNSLLQKILFSQIANQQRQQQQQQNAQGSLTSTTNQTNSAQSSLPKGQNLPIKSPVQLQQQQQKPQVKPQLNQQNQQNAQTRNPIIQNRNINPITKPLVSQPKVQTQVKTMTQSFSVKQEIGGNEVKKEEQTNNNGNNNNNAMALELLKTLTQLGQQGGNAGDSANIPLLGALISQLQGGLNNNNKNNNGDIKQEDDNGIIFIVEDI